MDQTLYYFRRDHSGGFFFFRRGEGGGIRNIRSKSQLDTKMSTNVLSPKQHVSTTTS